MAEQQTTVELLRVCIHSLHFITEIYLSRAQSAHQLIKCS